MPTVEGVPIDNAYNIVDDLGADPTGDERIDDIIYENYENTVLYLPPGIYRTGSFIGNGGRGNDDIEVDFNRFAMVGLGDHRRDTRLTTDRDDSHRMFDLSNNPNTGTAENFVMQNLSWDYTQSRSKVTGQTFVGPGDIYLTNVEHLGFKPHKGTRLLTVQITDPNREGEVKRWVRVGGTHHGRYKVDNGPDETTLCFQMGPDHRGTLRLTDLWVENASENALYVSNAPGQVRIRGGLYRNNSNTTFRVGGRTQTVEHTTTIYDFDRLLGGVEDPQAMENGRALWSFTRHHPHGAHFRNNDIIYESLPNTGGVYVVHSSAGEQLIENCRLYSAVDDHFIRMNEYEGSGDGQIVMDNCSFTGPRQGGNATFNCDGRPTIIQNSCIEMADDSASGDVTFRNISRNNCPLPDPQPTWVDGIDPTVGTPEGAQLQQWYNTQQGPGEEPPGEERPSRGNPRALLAIGLGFAALRSREKNN